MFNKVPKLALLYIIVYTQRAEYIPEFVGNILVFFFDCRKMAKCRSPPLFNLFLKNSN